MQNKSNQSSQNIIQLMKDVWHLIRPGHRRNFYLLLILALLVSFTEVLSIGLILPFLNVLISPDSLFSFSILQPFFQTFNITTSAQLLLVFSILFAVSAVLAVIMRMLMIWANARISFDIGLYFSVGIYQRMLYETYEFHCASNSSEMISNISNKSNSISGALNNCATIITSSVIGISILAGLIFIDPFVSLSTFFGFFLIYIFIMRITRDKLKRNSFRTSIELNSAIKALHEGLGGIRDILIAGNQPFYCQIFRKSDASLRKMQASYIFISTSPRFLMESLAMLLMALLAYRMTQTNSLLNAMPMLAAIAMAAQRLLPILQQSYVAFSSIRSSEAQVRDVVSLMNKPLPDYFYKPIVKSLPFKKHIKLKQLTFRYNEKMPWVLKQINLTIMKGSRVGFIGATGGGKSTLLDIIMGLLQPINGSLEVDGKIVNASNNRNWQKHIAHVPQAIFLSDSTIEENIAFGLPKDQINRAKVKQAAQKAQLADDIESWPHKYETFIGERGIRLSGGQRQRIGIARALYRNANVIIFDEATSSLDNKTEESVMRAIQNLNEDVTILIIAHRLTTLKNCTQIVELSNGRIKEIGSYKDLKQH